MRPEPRLSQTPLFAAIVSPLLLLGVLLSAGPAEVFAALPLIVLLVALVFKRYPGERLITRLADRFRPRRPRPASDSAPAHGALLWSRSALTVLAAAHPLRGPPQLAWHST
jgi:hypothetical protein